MATVIDGIGRNIAEIKIDGERAYPISHTEAIVYKEGAAGSGKFLDEKLGEIDTTLNTLANTKANSSDVYTKTQTNNLLNNKVDKVTGKGLSTNDFKVIELTNYLTESAELPTDNNLIYVYNGKVVEKRMCNRGTDNVSILFIVDRTVTEYEMDNLTVLVYTRGGGSDYPYEYDGTYHTNYSNCPEWVKAACGVILASTNNSGLMSTEDKDNITTLTNSIDIANNKITVSKDGGNISLGATTINIGNTDTESINISADSGQVIIESYQDDIKLQSLYNGDIRLSVPANNNAIVLTVDNITLRLDATKLLKLINLLNN